MPTADRPVSDLSALLLNQIALDQIGAEILNGGPRAIRYREDGGTTMVFVARHDDVTTVLTDEKRFSLRHYDPLYEAVAQKNAFLIMRPEGPERAERLDILKAAFALIPWFGPDPSARRALAKDCVEEVLAAVGPQRRFDLIGEYGFFVPYLLAKRVLGLTGPRSFNFFAFLIWVVNGHCPFRFFRPKIGPYMTDLAWSEFVIAQLLINFGNRNPYFRWAASQCAKRLRAQVERLVANPPHPVGDHTLLSALLAVQKTAPFRDVPKSDYREHVVSIMMELGSTLFVIPGSGFSGIIDRWLAPGGPGMEESLRQLRTMNAEEFVQEELRLAPPSAHLLRNAAHSTELGGLNLEEDEYVCALVKSAGLDISDEPDEVKAGRPQSTYLHFGPDNGPHRCVSHWFSPTILAEMFLGLTKLPGLRPRGNFWSFWSLVPGRLTVEFGERLMKRPSSLVQQPPFLICVSINHDEASPGDAARELESMLDRLGNPAGGALKWALDVTNVIHFLSMSVIWDQDSDDPPMLVADVAGDGHPNDIIAALVRYAGVYLLPVFKAAAGINTESELRILLARNRVDPVPTAFPLWPRQLWHRVTGLAFQGTPGLALNSIRRDERIARAARDAVFGRTPSGPSPALSYVDHARATVGHVARTGEPFDYSDAPPTLSKANFLTRFLSLIVFDWSFLLIALFTLAYLNTKEIIAPILLGESSSNWQTILFAMPLALVFGFVANLIINFIQSTFKRELSDRDLYVLAGVTVLIFVFATWGAFHLSAIASMKWSPQWLEDIQFYPFSRWMAGVIGLLSLVLFLASVAIVLLAILRAHENSDKPCDADPDVTLLTDLMRREDLAPYKQNHMISMSTIKPGPFRRRVALPAGLYASGLTVRAGLFKTGFLSGIGTIHFIQWACIPGTRKLVFTGNYDGSWQGYLEDAITQLPQGASAIWSNATGFPKTRLLFSDGATDGDRFKRWVRRQMIPTRFWYSAYPHLTASDIRINAAIRQGLEAKVITPSEAEAWLKLFGSAPRPVSEIECEQIQGITLSCYRNLREGALLAVSLPRHQTDCRAWLAGVSDRVDFGDSRQSRSAMAVAISASGLKKLGLESAHPLAAQFSPPFAMGMANEARTSALGDVDDNSPSEWRWGGPEDPIDAVLLIYAANQTRLRKRLIAEAREFCEKGIALKRSIRFHRWPRSRDAKGRPIPVTEPFGFVDGISQPSIKGLLSSRGAIANDLMEPGEFILGYPDGRKQFPPTPQVFATDDPDNLLPDLPPNFPPPPSQVDASPDHAPPLRDLGRNGSYLVIRQLKQKVDEYRDYVNKAAKQFPEWGWGAPDWVAAKMVGRWPNGAPLVLFPSGPPGPGDYSPISKDETFRFGRDDPQGLACPFGAHIRRTNPRDQFDPDDKQQMKITNRHRILRRGRAYVDGVDPVAKAQGLLFMCLNADIERQFEFLQQSWVGSKSFGPLRNEADPLTAMNRKDGTYTIPTLEGPKQVTGIPSFVSMIGGGYFFLPGKQALAYLSR